MTRDPEPSMPGVRAEAAIIRQLRQFPEVERALVFGSRGRGDYAARSDIDVAVSCPAADPGRWAEIEAAVQEAETLLLIDIVRLEDAEYTFRDAIIATGRTMYERLQA
jgi:uncharacterized protein